MRGLNWLLILGALIDIALFGLTDLDEGFYASVSWEMRQRGDYLTPTFQGEPWFEKPPLIYWLMNASMRVFGENTFALRLPSVLMYWLTMIALGVWGNRRFGNGVGTKSALLFGVAPLSLLLARMAITDMTLTFFLLVAVIALWESRYRPFLWSVMGGIALGLAALTKGPFSLGLVGLLYLWQGRALPFRWALMALGIAFCVALPWYGGVYGQHGSEFFMEFVVRQNLLRFVGGDTAHSVWSLIGRGGTASLLTGIAVYLLFYVLILWVGGFPMAGFMEVLWQRHESPLMRYLQRWCWLVFGLFTISFTKLPAYIFPMFPMLALLIAQCWSAFESRSSTRIHGTHWLGVSGGLLWGIGGLLLAFRGQVWWASAILFGAGAIAWASALWGKASWQWAFGVLMLLIGWNGALVGYDRVVLHPVRELALAVPPYRTLVLYRVNPGYPSLWFYRKGRYTTAESWDEVFKRMQKEGAYCLTTDRAVRESDSVIVLDSQEVLGRTFYLLTPRYQ